MPTDERKGFYTTIAPQGDVELVLQSDSIEDICTYRVSSERLCAASPVFRAMLGPDSRFSEAVELRRVDRDGNGLCKVNAECCDPNALAAVLKIFHGCTHDLPDDIEFKALVDVAVICDYYDCALAVESWAEKWIKPWKIYIIEPGYDSWILIAKVFKDKESYSKIASHLILNCVVENGKLALVVENVYQTRRELGEHIPHGKFTIFIADFLGLGAMVHDCVLTFRLDQLIAQRTKACYVLQSTLRSLYSRYNGSSMSSPVCQNTNVDLKTRIICDYLILGYLHSHCPPFNNPKLECFDHLSLWQIKATIVQAVSKMEASLSAFTTSGYQHTTCMKFTQFITDMQETLDQLATLELPDADKPRVSTTTKRTWEVFAPTN
jgi:hypothetical protein